MRARRVAAIAATAALIGISLVACSSTGSTAKEPQKFTLAFSESNSKDDSVAQVAKAFEKLHPGVTITLQLLPAESYPQAIATRIQGGNAPDVFNAESGIGQTNSLQPFAKAGLLLELTDPQIDKDLAPAGLAQFQYKGKTYGVSRGSGLNGVVYNNDAAESIGIKLNGESTFKDVIAACATAKAAGKSLYGLAGSIPANPSILAQAIAASTVYGVDPEWNAKRAAGKVTFANTKGWKTAITAIETMFKADCFQPGAAGAGFDALTNGSSSGALFGFFAPGGAAASIEAASGGHVKLQVLPFPNPTGGKTWASVSSDQALSASAKTKSPKLVQEFLAYVASPAGQKIVGVGPGFPVGTTDEAQIPETYKSVSSIITSKDYQSFGPIEWANGKVNDDLGAGIQGVLTGQTTADQVLQQMDTDWG